MLVTIFAAGLISDPHLVHLERQPGDKVIAADGGARHCLALKIIPDIVIGDFDSLSASDIDELQDSGARLIRYSERKDFTDLELAIQHACQMNASEIQIYGALGLRWDQTLANILLLASPELDCVSIRLLDGDQEIYLIRNKVQTEIHGQPGDTVSLIPIGGNAHDIYTQGLEYPLNGETLLFGKARGVSNVIVENPARISLQEGYLICTVIHH